MRKALSFIAALLFCAPAFGQGAGQLPAGYVWGNSSASRAPSAPASVSAILDRALGSTRGAIIERGASGWVILTPGATAGVPFITNGTGADPSYGQITGAGSIAGSALPAPTALALGGVKSATAPTHQWFNVLDGTGALGSSQPGCGDLSNAAASCSVDATNASNIASGTLPAARLPNPSATTLGGIESYASVSHQFINAISTLGVPSSAQPACADISNAGTGCTVNTGTSGATIPLNNGGFTQSGTANFTGTFQINGNAQTFPATAATLAQTIASGSTALGTGAIASGACATTVTATATGTATTDVVTASFNSDPTGVTGYIPSTSGMLTIIIWPTANTVNLKVCNNTGGSITPGAITLNWRVSR